MYTQNNRAQLEKEAPGRGFLSRWLRGSDVKRSRKRKPAHPVKHFCTLGATAVLITSIFLLTLATRSHAITWSGELLTNPGFETGDATGWTNGGGGAVDIGNMCFACDDGPHSGTNKPYWNTDPESTYYLYQTVASRKGHRAWRFSNSSAYCF